MKTPLCKSGSSLLRPIATFGYSLALLGLFAGVPASAQSLWSGTNGVTATTNWSDAANWSPPGVPGATEHVQFFDGGTVGAAGTINSVVDTSSTNLSLWVGPTNGFHTILIAPGQLLQLSGGVPGLPNTPLINAGFDAYTTTNQVVNATITGDQGTLNLTNTGGSLQVRVGYRTNAPSTKATLDMSGLGTFNADLTAIRAGVESADPRGVSGFIYLARTNSIVVRGAGYDANFSSGNPALVMGHNTAGGGAMNTNGSAIFLGIANAIFVDYVVVSRGNQSNCFFGFNPAFLGNSPSAFFRGLNGTNRVGLWKVGDNSAGSQTGRNGGDNNFTGGTVDALINNLLIGFSRSSGANSNQGVGTFIFDLGTVDANRVTLGYNTNELCTPIGTLNINGGKLVVNDMFQLAQVPPAATPAVAALTTGTVNIRGGAQVFANLITNSGGIGRITSSNGTLIVTNFLGFSGAPVNFLALSNTALTLPAYGFPSAVVTNLALGGTANTLNISSIPAILSYPIHLPLIKYTGALAGAFNLGLGTLPFSPSVPFAGVLSNNTANSSVDLVLTAGPLSRNLLWRGDLSYDWDIGTTANWITNGVATTYNQLDFPRFDDTASTNIVNLTATFFPGTVTVSNTGLYTFTDSGSGLGKISGTSGLIKQGAGTLLINNSAANDFVGGVTISNGVIKIGNNDTFGNLPSAGAILNNGTLLYDRMDPVAVPNIISGTGSVIQSNAASTLTLSGVNSFTGLTLVPQGTLAVGNNAALGATNSPTVLSNNAALDVSGAGLAANGLNLGAERVFVSGVGPDGVSGAIVNSGNAGQQNALQNVTLSGHTTFGGNARWDIRAPGGSGGNPAGGSLSTGGQAYNLTKVGNNFVGLVSLTVDPNLNDIDVQAGTLNIEGNTTGLGNSARTLNVASSATLYLQNTTNRLNKQFVLNDQSTVSNNAGANTIIGPMTLSGDVFFTVNGASLTLSNSIGGTGRLVKSSTGTNTLFINGTTTNSGGIIANTGSGIVSVNGTVVGSLVNESPSIITGTGLNTGVTTVGGTLNPGSVDGVGTFTASAVQLTGEGLLFDLTATNTANGGVSDLLQVNGDLTPNLTVITINPLHSSLQAGNYRIINYAGAMPNEFNPNPVTTTPTRYTLSIVTNVANQISINVAGAAANVRWSGTSSTTWDTAGTANWFNLGGLDVFYTGDSVLLDDTAGVTNSITLDNGPVSPSSITNNSSTINYTISGTNKITGGGGFVKLGSSMLTINTANDFVNDSLILGGTLRAGNNAALGATNVTVTITNSATLDAGGILGANALNFGLRQFVVSGSGVGGNGAIVNNSANAQQNAFQRIRLTADTVFGGSNRWDLRAVGNAATNGSQMSVGGNNAIKLTKAGTNRINIVNINVDSNLGDIEHQAGILGVEATTTSLGNPTNTLTIYSNASFNFFQVSNTLSKGIVIRDGGVVANENGTNRFGGPITLQGGSNVFNVGGVWLLLTNAVSGPGNLYKTAGNLLWLSVPSSYTGNTFVNGGTLALTNTGSITTTPAITIASGATLDVLGRADRTLALAGGQTIKGNGTVNGLLVASANSVVSPGLSIGILTVSSNTTLQTDSLTAMEYQKAPSVTNDQLRVTGSNSITYSGTLSLTNLGGTLTGGESFKLFSATNYFGSFASIIPNQPGLGLRWDTNSLNTAGLAGGTLKVAVLPKPGISNISLIGANIVLSGTNGTAGYSYRVLTSTNIAVPINSWTILGTNTFGPGGIFNFTNAPTEPQQFYTVQAL